jgi:hypothetical protein
MVARKPSSKILSSMKCTLPAFSCCRPSCQLDVGVNYSATAYQSLLTKYPPFRNESIWTASMPGTSLRCLGSGFYRSPIATAIHSIFRCGTALASPRRSSQLTTFAASRHIIPSFTPAITTRSRSSLPLQRQVTSLLASCR